MNFRETVSAGATRDMSLDAKGAVVKDASLIGWKAAGAPGTVMGLHTAEREHGRRARAQVMDPTIRLAREGFVLTRGDTDVLDARAPERSSPRLRPIHPQLVIQMPEPLRIE